MYEGLQMCDMTFKKYMCASSLKKKMNKRLHYHVGVVEKGDEG